MIPSDAASSAVTRRLSMSGPKTEKVFPDPVIPYASTAAFTPRSTSNTAVEATER